MTYNVKNSIVRTINLLKMTDVLDESDKISLEQSLYNVLHNKKIEISDFDILDLKDSLSDDYNLNQIFLHSKKIVTVYEIKRKISLDHVLKKDLLLVFVKKMLELNIYINSVSLNKNLNKFERKLLQQRADEEFRKICFAKMDKYLL